MHKTNLLLESKNMFSVHAGVLFDYGKRIEYLWKTKQAHVQGRYYSSPNV